MALPDLGGPMLKAKIDTGARTSAMHAFQLEVVLRSRQEWVKFEIHPDPRGARGAVRVEHPVSGWLTVRSSNGDVQRRPVIRTEIQLGAHRWLVDITLTNRDEMGFRMLVGRAAIRRKFTVDPSRSFCAAVE